MEGDLEDVGGLEVGAEVVDLELLLSRADDTLVTATLVGVAVVGAATTAAAACSLLRSVLEASWSCFPEVGVVVATTADLGGCLGLLK